MNVSIDSSKVNGPSNNSSFGLQFRARKAKRNEHILMASAAYGKSAFRLEVFRDPIHIAHDIAHVHVDIELFEVDSKNDQGLPRMSRGETDPSGGIFPLVILTTQLLHCRALLTNRGFSLIQWT